ncbi:MAG: hypothetical protein ACO378_05780 [Sedimenticolaceae bacterium]
MLQRTIIFSLFISLTSSVSAVGSGNLFGDLMQGMTKGLAQLNQQQNTNQPQWNFPPGLEPLSETRNNTNFPYPRFNQPYYAPPFIPIERQLLQYLQGNWQTNRGGLMLVRGNLARLYVDAKTHQDLYIRIDPEAIWLQPANNPKAIASRYDFQIDGNQIALRDMHMQSLVLIRHIPETVTE